MRITATAQTALDLADASPRRSGAVVLEGEAMKCHFCKKFPPAAFDDMCDAGWIPSFWDGETEVDNPVCGECCKDQLQFNVQRGGFSLKVNPLGAVVLGQSIQAKGD